MINKKYYDNIKKRITNKAKEMKGVHMKKEKGKRKKKKTFKEKIFNLALGILMLAVVVIVLFPVWNMVVRSFNCNLLFVSDKNVRHWDRMSAMSLWPKHFTLQNYIFLMKDSDILCGLLNSVLRTVIGTLLGVGINGILAFVLSRKEFRFRTVLGVFWIVACSMEIGMVPMLAYMKAIHFSGSFLVYVIPGLVNIFYVFVIRSYMNMIPDEMINQARLDGASYGEILVKIVSPLCKPIYAAVALYIAASQWNAWFDAYLYNRAYSEYTVLQREIFSLMSSCACGAGLEPARAAASVIAMLPIVILGLCMQKYYLHSVEELFAYRKKR